MELVFTHHKISALLNNSNKPFDSLQNDTMSHPVVATLETQRFILSNSVLYPNGNLSKFQLDQDIPDFGGIHVAPVDWNHGRLIAHNDSTIWDKERSQRIEEMSNQDRNMPKRKFYHDEDLEDDPPDGCYRNNWKTKISSYLQFVSRFVHVTQPGAGYPKLFG